MSLLPPTCVLLLSKNFDPSLFFNVAPSLSMSMYNLYFFVSISSKAFISLYNLFPFVINFHKRCVSHWCKGIYFGVDGWGLSLVFLMDISLFVGMTPVVGTTCILCRASWDTTHKIFFYLEINLWDTSPYVIAWVIHLIHLSSCSWGMYSLFDDHLKLRITYGTIVLHDWYHM